jgi:hypothetical protein
MLSSLGYQSVTGSTPVAAPASWPLPALDRLVVAYLAFPLVIFLAGWLQLVVALPLLGCVAYSLRALIARAPAGTPALPVTRLHLAVAVAVGIAWTYLGGTAHFVFANADWYVRDAVLHDLVTSPWPVGYGQLGGRESMLRAPLAYYLPAALTGKMLGLAAAHLALSAWTAAGACLFLLQVLSLTRSRLQDALLVCAIVVLFSGMDIIGSLLNLGPRFLANMHLGNHIEWWAGRYQYSSMTTQLFWVPNHALGGWLTIGLLCRDRTPSPLHPLLPIVIVAVMMWSPLTALGVVPFVLWRVLGDMARTRTLHLLHPRVWAPALAVGLVVAAYLVLDAGAIPKGWIGGNQHVDVLDSLGQQAQFFLLEAGLTGFAILALKRSPVVALALAILAILPAARFGPGNDLVMRGSIPSLTVLAIASCLVLLGNGGQLHAARRKATLGLLLLIGAVTPVEELARALILPAWPISMQATLLDASCGIVPAHYIAHLGDEMIGRLLRAPHRLGAAGLGRAGCTNPAWRIMNERGLLDT